MATSAFPSTSLGLPASLDYKLAPSLSPDSKAYWVSVSPDSLQSVTTPVAVPLGTLAIGTSPNNPFNSQILAFTIPTGDSPSVFMDCRETTLNFKLTVQVTTATNAAMISHSLVSSAQSFFDSLTLYSNNVPIEQIGSYGVLASQLLAATLNSAERYGGGAVSLGGDTNTFQGIDLPLGNALGTWYFNFSIPLISVIGINNQQHLFPVGMINNLQLQMQTATTLPFVSYNTTALTNGGAMLVTISDVSLNMKYINIGADSTRLLLSTLNGGKVFMKTQTWVQSSANIPINSAGTQNILYQIRNSSVKSLLIQNTMPNAGASVGITPNGQYDAINPSLTQFNVSIGGVYHPQRPLSPTMRPAECFLHFMSALGMSGDWKRYGGCITRSGYGATAAAVAGSDSSIVVPANGLRAESSFNATNQVVAQFPCQAYLGIDFEKSSGVLFSGVNTRASPPVGNYYIQTPVPNTVTSFAFALVDCVLVVDGASSTIQAFV